MLVSITGGFCAAGLLLTSLCSHMYNVPGIAIYGHVSLVVARLLVCLAEVSVFIMPVGVVLSHIQQIALLV